MDDIPKKSKEEAIKEANEVLNAFASAMDKVIETQQRGIDEMIEVVKEIKKQTTEN